MPTVSIMLHVIRPYERGTGFISRMGNLGQSFNDLLKVT